NLWIQSFLFCLGNSTQDSADLVLLIDGSENVGAANFPLVRDLALRVIEGLDVGRDMIRVALVLYGADPEIKFYLNSYDNKADIRNVVQGLKFLGGDDSNLGAALEQVTESLLGPEAGGRAEEGVPQALVIISAGQSTDDISEGERALKQANVFTFGVAVGESASAQLQAVATEKSFVLQILMLVTLDFFISALAVSKRDIIFLIDSSMGSTSINAVREFIRKFIDTMPIGTEEVQIGVAMFSNTPRVEIDLNSFDSKEALISALGRIKPKPSPDVNIGAALDFVRTNMLTSGKGSRIQEAVPQLVLLITSKKSRDSVQQPAEALQREGVLTLAVGSKAADEAELKQIAFAEKIEITTIQTQRVVRDFVFLVDGSDYVGNANLPSVREFMSGIVTRLDVRPERVRIGLMQFADTQKTEFYLNSHTTKQDVLANIAQLRLMGGNVVRTGAALQYAIANHFQASAGSRRNQGVQQVLILITGASSQDEVKRVADQVALAGVLTFAVGAGQVAENELRTVAFVPNLAYYEQSFTALPSLVEQILTPLTTVVGNHGDGGERDVAFLIDGSDDVRRDFGYIRDFIIKVIEPLDVSFDKVRVAVAQHSDRATPSFYLNTYKTKEEVLRALRGLTPVGGRSLNTGIALKFMKDTVLSSNYGSRAAQNVPQFLIVLTGGKSRDSVKEPANALKTEGVVPFGVGVKNADPKQIELCESTEGTTGRRPHGRYVNFYNVLMVSSAKLLCGRGWDFVFLKVFFIIYSVLAFGNKVAKDVVFLLDGSDVSKNGFPAVRDFVEKVVEKLNVEEGKDRISVVQYSEDSSVNFYLNTHTRKQDMLNAIKVLKHKGGSGAKLGAALQFVRHQVFTSSSGSRRLEGVQQVLILLSSRGSSDEVAGPASALRDLEVVSLSIGVGNTWTTYHTLECLTQLVRAFTFICNLFPGDNFRDIVFLFDGSDQSRNGLPAIREFIRRMAVDLDIDRDDVRIAVVQYSEDTLVHFDLNTHKSQKDIIYAIRNLRPKGGRVLNTGAALQYVRSNIFTTASGSRYERGVPQLLIVMIGGESSDDVAASAEDLKTFGVLSIAIGLKNAVQRELESIAYSSRFLFNLPVFGELLSVQMKPRRDVVFLLDGSGDTRDGFPIMRQFVERMVDKFNIDENKDRVSVVQYSTQAQAHFLLNSYFSKRDVLKSLGNMQHRGGRPLNTGAALEYVKNHIFIASAGSRHFEGVPQILILVTGGRSQDDVRGPAAALKHEKIVPFSVGTQTADIIQLQAISYVPSHTFTVSQFDNLQSIEQELMSYVKRVPSQPRRLQSTLDIVVLIDGSDNTKESFSSVKAFVQLLAERLNIGQNQDQMSVVQYSDKAAAEFFLNTHSTKKNVIDAVKQLKHTGGQLLNTGAALTYANDNVFTIPSGSRRLENVPQILILLSAGRSTDDVRGPVKALKEKGVIIFSIGTKNADTLELQTLSHQPNYFFISNSDELFTVSENILSLIQGLSIKQVATMIPPFSGKRFKICFILI
uniref:Collagen, type VI, alpha 3 n=1 Tax=Astyanax mexicanus TaxID=7994 RepID=A0A8B9H437_ASTMX